VAVWKGKVFSATFDGRLIALDAATGELIWETLTVDHHLDKNYPYTITGAPRLVKGKVIIGNGGAEYGVRGYLGAYDADSGKQLWRFYTVPGNPADGFESPAMERAAKTWKGEWWKFGGGGTVWDSIVYDPELNLLYFGTGNGSPWNREIRSPGGGDNLYLSSIVAINPDNGEYVWHFQEVPAENFDYTATQHIMIADLEIDGKNRKVLLHAPKNGFFFVIDRISGELLSADPFVEVNWATHYDLATGRPVETEKASYQKGAGMIRPSSAGAHNWHPMAYNPMTGLVYIPAMENAYYFDPLAIDEYQHEPGQWNLGIKDIPNPSGDQLFAQAMVKKTTQGHLSAWDPVARKEKWRVPYDNAWNGGLLSTAGNLVFQGTFDGEFIAYSADKGEKLWSMPVQTGVMAPPVTFSVNGEQYVTVLAGRGGAFGLASGLQQEPIPKKSRLLTFKLGGNQRLPALATELEIPDPPPQQEFDKAVIEQGGQLYHKYCIGCHGYNVISNGAIPDLRRMPRHFHDAFKEIVYDGQLKSLGMVGFSDVMSEADVEAVHAFIIARAHEDKAQRESPGWFVRSKKVVYEAIAALINWLI
jgi:quinohemoprotein ethanol dehydrogenase